MSIYPPPITNFISYLDSYKAKKQINYSEYIALLVAIQDNYVNDFAPRSYTYDSQPTWSKTEIPVKPSLSYFNWQKDTCVFDMSSVFFTPLMPVEKTKVTIDTSANTLKDIIHIIQNNTYSEENEYNIDLKSLHKIKDELLQLDSMVGMTAMKTAIVEQLLYFIQDLHIGKIAGDYKNTVLYGPPGTGKTEVAKIIGKMYSKLGVLKNNVFKKVTRNDLIAGYLGQTAIKTKKVIEECIGGVLFIDEAYSLGSNGGESVDSYSKECLDILCESLSDHKSDLMVIIAGYEDDLNETFFRINKGLQSRFIWRFSLSDYSSSEMMQIFRNMVIGQEWEMVDDSILTAPWFEQKKEHFKYFGRDMELLLTYTKIAHGRRIYGLDKSLRKKISLQDLNEGYQTFLKNRKGKEKTPFMHSIYV
jgi:SpoVK/Ycf46/Vps4 family AAA+-type ATPase